MKIAKAIALFVVASVVVVLAAGQITSSQSRITQPIDESKLVVLRGNTHPLARAEYDRGAAPASLPLERMMLVLKTTPQQGAALDQLLAEQQDRSSANYHKWLTPEEFGARFGASDADIQKVTAWLTSHGFTIDTVAKGHNLIEFSGNAVQLQTAFHTVIHNYEIEGKKYFANANDPAIPAALTPAVEGIASLNNFPRHAAHRLAGTFSYDRATHRAAAKPSRNPEFTFAGGCQGTSGSNCYGVAPFDFATIYNLLPLWNGSTKIDGTGQTIAIVSDTDITSADFTNFRSLFGLPAGTLNQIHNGSDPGVITCASGGNECEAVLDAEWSGAVAPGATIDLVVSADTTASFGGDLSAEYIIDNKTANILGYSYGLCEFFLGTSGNAFYGGTPVKDVTGEWAQAATEGITVSVSTGDVGATGCESNATTVPAQYGLAVNGIASTPYNVAVGGTDFNDATNPTTYWSSGNNSNQESALGYIPEVTYNDSCTNLALDVLADSSASSTNAEANCNLFNSDAALGLQGLIAPFGGGGGLSNCTTSNFTVSGTTATGSFSSCAGGYTKPAWQTALTPADGKRDLPDIALFSGDGTFQNFYVYCEQDMDPSNAACSLNAGTSTSPYPDIQGVGGTSVATEVFAGMIALLNQKLGSPVGLPNTNLYALAGQASLNCQSSGTLNSACIFYQVTSGTIAMPCTTTATSFGTPPGCTIATSGDTIGVTTGYSAGSGYNMATGLGSINVYNLVNDWNVGSGGAADYTLSASPTSISVNPGAKGTTTITVVPINGFSDTVNFSASSCSGLPTGYACSFSSSNVAANGSTTVTIQPAAAAVPPSLSPVRWRMIGIMSLGCALAMSILLVAFRRSDRRWGVAIASAVFVAFVGIAGCGGGGNGGGGGGGNPVATPTFTPVAGTYPSGQLVAIADSTSGATIYYTTNGTTPTTSSSTYSSPIAVSSSETIEAIAAASGMSNSAVASAAYTINPTPAAITISGTSATGNVTHSTTVQLTIQ